MATTRVFIVDEHAPVRAALAERLARSVGVEVVGHAGEAREVLDQVRERRPDVVILETKRSDGMGLELIRQLAGLPDAPRLVVLTSYPSDWEERAARRAGASSYLLKEIDSEELIRRLDVLVAH